METQMKDTQSNSYQFSTKVEQFGLFHIRDFLYRAKYLRFERELKKKQKRRN